MEEKQKILIVDDELDFCDIVSDVLRSHGYLTEIKNNPVEALEWLSVHQVDLILLDIIMPQMEGTKVLSEIVQNWPEIPVIMITGQSYNVPVAMESAKRGSYSFLPKPIDSVTLTEFVKNALSAKRPRLVSTGIEGAKKDLGIVSASQKFEEILMTASRVAKINVPVLITGESGVGKEVLARFIHHMSSREKKPFVSIDCGALTETLLESELFGHVKGAFTGSVADKKGLFEEANGGTIFLDEIANTTLTFQQKLLLVLDSGKVRRVGDTKEREVNVRIISATNKNLVTSIAAGEFREDLFYRMNTFDIFIPPLRERREDILLLARILLTRAVKEHGLPNHYFSPAALELLSRQDWRGNVRELKSVVTKLAITVEVEEIDVHIVAPALKVATKEPKGPYVPDHRPLMDQVEEFEKNLIIEALKASRGNKTKSAELLGVERTNFHKKIEKHAIVKEDYS